MSFTIYQLLMIASDNNVKNYNILILFAWIYTALTRFYLVYEMQHVPIYSSIDIIIRATIFFYYAAQICTFLHVLYCHLNTALSNTKWSFVLRGNAKRNQVSFVMSANVLFQKRRILLVSKTVLVLFKNNFCSALIEKPFILIFLLSFVFSSCVSFANEQLKELWMQVKWV